MVRLGPYPAGGPARLEGRGAQNRPRSRIILVGDVWICSGQSNMEWSVSPAPTAPRPEVAASRPSQDSPVHVSPTSRPSSRAARPSTPTWKVCSTRRPSAEFSAVGYFFGRDLQRELNVPIGLIDSSYGGTTGRGLDQRRGRWNPMGDFQSKALGTGPVSRRPTRRQAPGEVRPGDGRLVEEERPRARPRRPPGPTPSSTPTAGSRWNSPGTGRRSGQPDFDGIAWFRKEVELPESLGWEAELTLAPGGDRRSRHDLSSTAPAVGHDGHAWNARQEVPDPRRPGEGRAGT